MTKWFVKKDGRMFGPYDVAELERLVEKGTVDADTLVRLGCDGPWSLAGQTRLMSDDESNEIRVPEILQATTSQPTEIPSLDLAQIPIPTPAPTASGRPRWAMPPDRQTSEAKSVDQTKSVKGNLPSVPRPASFTSSSKPTNNHRVVDRPSTGGASTGGVSEKRTYTAAALNCVLPGSGDWYLGRQQTGLMLMCVIPLLYVTLWAGGIMIAKMTINAVPTSVQTVTDFGGNQPVADQAGSPVLISLLIVFVLVFFLVPIGVHLYTIVRVVGTAERSH